MARVIRISHIGLATASIAEALRVFGDGLGLAVSGEEEVPGDNVRVVFAPVGESRFEFLEPVGDEGPLQKFLERGGRGFTTFALRWKTCAGC